MSLFITYIPILFYYTSGTKVNNNKSKALHAGIWKIRPPNEIYN